MVLPLSLNGKRTGLILLSTVIFTCPFNVFVNYPMLEISQFKETGTMGQ